MVSATAYLWVLLGSALGGLARYWLGSAISRRLSTRFPWGTLAVNVSGAVAIGLVVGGFSAGALGGLDPTARQLLVFGFLGSYTTVSSFSLQTLTLAREHTLGAAAANVALSVTLCLFGAWGGYLAGSALA